MPQSYFNNFRALGIFVTISLYRKGLKMKTVTLFICNVFSHLYAYVFDMTLHDAKLEMLWSIACGCLWLNIYFLWFYNDEEE